MKTIHTSRIFIIILFVFLLVKLSATQITKNKFAEGIYPAMMQAEKNRVITLANQFLKEKPVTVTASQCERSAGGKHDYYSEATYWWPNPERPNGPYIRKDGLNNPKISTTISKPSDDFRGL